jgi:hypothetical protein
MRLQKKILESFYIQRIIISLTLNAGRMANAVAHRRDILEIQKTSGGFLVRLRTIPVFILSRNLKSIL